MADNAPTVPRIEGKTWLVVTRDANGSAALRRRELARHLDYVERHYERYLVAGPLRRPGEEPLCGSFFLIDAPSLAEARTLVDEDPYTQSGVYAEISVHAATPAVGRLLGGVIWETVDDVAGTGGGQA